MISRYHDVALAELVVTARSPHQPGREDAFGEIVRRFSAGAQTSAFRLVRDTQLAQDVAQEAFVEAYIGLGQLRDPAAFPGWFRRIVFKHADRILRRSRSAFFELGSAEAQPHAGVSPEACAAARENIARVRAALLGLPEHERVVIVLFYFAHRSHAEIGKRLMLPLSTVKKRLHDARRRLRTPLEVSHRSNGRATCSATSLTPAKTSTTPSFASTGLRRTSPTTATPPTWWDCCVWPRPVRAGRAGS